MRKHILILLASLLLAANLPAQRMYRFSIGKMSDNRFHAICEDMSGFIWIGTENGLNRYDGYNFRTFYHDDNDSLSLMSNYVRSLYTDSNGTLWIGTNRGVQYLKPSDKSFITVPFPGNQTPYIQKIYQASDGYIWIVAQNHGIYRINPNNPVQLTSVVSLNTHTSGGIFRTLIEDQEGIIWIGTPTGVLLLDPTTDRVSEFRRDIIDRDITGINMDSDGNVYITTNNHLFKWDITTHNLIRISPPNGVWEITHSFMDNDGLKISLRGKGLLTIGVNNRLERLKLKPLDGVLDKMDVSAYYKDKAGNRWIGGFLSDLILVTKEQNELEYHRFTDYQSNISGTVTAMIADSDGNLWIGYNNNGLACLSNQGTVLRDGSENIYVSCMYRDSNNKIWVGYPSGGLAELDPNSGNLKSVIRNEYSNISSITQDMQGRIYYSELGSGFSRFDPANPKVELYSDFASTDNGIGLSNSWIHFMVTDSLNRLWIAHDNGADCFDIESNKFIKYSKLANIMGTSSCTSIIEESKGVIWFGTTKGVIVYNTNNGKVALLNTSQGLSHNDVRSMVKDNNGLIWISTPGGVNSINPITLDVSRYYTEEHEFNRVSAFSESDNKVYFGSNNGITSFYPHKIVTETVVNPVIMTGFYIHGEPITSQTLSGGKKISIKPLSQSRQFRVAYRDNSFTLEFTTLNYGDETSIIYEYSLYPDKNEWISNPPGVNRFTFSNLRHGKHNLAVRGRLNDYVSDAVTYTIKVDAPWYATSVAIILYVLLCCSIFMFVVWIYRKSRIREMEQTKFQLFTNVAHEICAPMTMIISPLEEMLNSETSPHIQSNLQLMYKSSTKILSLINQLLDMRKYDDGQMHLKYAKTDLINFLMGPFELYTQTAEKRSIDFKFVHSMAELPVWIDRDSIDKVMMNLLSNAFKYTSDGGSIEISVEVGTNNKESGPLQNYVQISISDTGIGIDKDDINRIFQRFYRANNNATLMSFGMGIGLNYSQMLINMHQGTIKASNRSDGKTGSVFELRLPLGNDHIAIEDMVKEGERVARPHLEHSRHSVEMTETPKDKKLHGVPKILIVDDDETMIEFLKNNLKNSYRIFTARNGKEGLNSAISLIPDLIITDVVMPEMDGIKMVTAIKKNSIVSHIPVIMLSGKSKLQDRMIGIDTGADSYLPKPFYMSELKALILNLISNRLKVKGKYSGHLEKPEEVDSIKLKTNDELFMKRVMEVVNNNISNSSFTINQLADEIGISRAQLHRNIKETTGFPASKFLHNIRLQQAAKLLKEKKDDVTQIAYMVGFSTPTYFATLFKQYYGVTPSEYITNLEKEEEGK